MSPVENASPPPPAQAGEAAAGSAAPPSPPGVATLATRLDSPRLFVALLALAVLGAALVRWPGVHGGLPYLSYIDEGHLLHPAASILRGEPWRPGATNDPPVASFTIAAGARLAALVADPWREQPLLAGIEPFHTYDVVAPTALVVSGRVVCLLASLGVVLLAGLLGRRTGGAAGGVVAAFAAALLPALVVRGTVVAVDALATLLVLAAAWLAAAVERPAAWKRLALAGACCGLAAVTKYPAGLAGLGVAIPALLAPWPWRDRLRGAAAATAGALAAAVAAMPWALTAPEEVWGRILWQGEMYRSLSSPSLWSQAFVTGEWDLPLPYPEIGVPFALWAAAGVVCALASRRWRRHVVGWLAFAVALGALHSRYGFQPFRNLLPVAALACVAAGCATGALISRVRRPVAVSVGALGLLAALFAAPARHYVEQRSALVDSRSQAVAWLLAERPAVPVLVQSEAAFAPAELARLGGRARSVGWRTLPPLLGGRPPLLVVGDLVDPVHGPLLERPFARRLFRLYRPVAEFGDSRVSADPWTWRGNRMRVVVLERRGAAPPRGRPRR
jgi:hypothetical protein